MPCRVEHYISPEGLKGIENFLQYGDVYDRVYDDMDLYTFYEDGEFPMAFGLYEPERRNPRFLAPEYGKLEHSVILRVKKVPELLPAQDKKGTNPSAMYGTRRDDEWIQAKRRKRCLSVTDRHLYLYCQYRNPDYRSSGNHCDYTL